MPDRKTDRHPVGHRPPIYELYGLKVRSEIELNAPVRAGTRADLVVSWGDSVTVPDDPPAGRVVARLPLSHSGYTYVETEDGYTLRFHATCEFRLARDGRALSVHLAPGANRDVVPLLLTGNVLAFLLTLRGECVLHASAVEVGDVALAFVGGPNMGKSTLAAFLCASGATLLTDDVLRLEPEAQRPRCFRGGFEVRLRPGAAALAEEFPAAACTRTVDDRVALRIESDSTSRPPLHAIVIPLPARDAKALRLERLPPTEALYNLIRYPRVLGLQATELVRSQFQALARVAQTVPVYRATIPWGPPFDRGLASALRDGVGLPR